MGKLFASRKKIIALFLAVMILATPVLGQQGGGDYFRGKLDGERDARGNPLWVLAGLSGTGCCLLIGCAGVGLAYAVPPSPPPAALMGKSSEYVLGYTEGYKSKARLKNTAYAAAGCCAAAAVNVVINLALGWPFELE